VTDNAAAAAGSVTAADAVIMQCKWSEAANSDGGFSVIASGRANSLSHPLRPSRFARKRPVVSESVGPADRQGTNVSRGDRGFGPYSLVPSGYFPEGNVHLSTNYNCTTAVSL